jgi:hypothetical protein
MKKWWQSKTLWLNVAVAAGAALEMNLGLVQGMLKPHHYLAALVAVNAVNVALRFITSQPIK